jgi:hypothetical protein
MDSLKHNTPDSFLSPEMDYKNYKDGDEVFGYRVLNSLYYENRLGDTSTYFDYGNTEENSQNLRAVYIERTRALIENIIENKIDVVIFLDKSGRPVQWMMSELWPIFAGETQKPESYFANVDAAEFCGLDKESGVRPTDEEVEEAKKRVTEDDLQQIRDVYRPRLIIGPDNESHLEPLFDGKNVLIVDETSVSGHTLGIAEFLFSKSFPGANFSRQHWQFNHKKILGNGREISLNNPVWYSSLDVTGRGVGDKSGPILSRPLSGEGKDERSEWLREDIKQLARDILNGKQWVIFDETKPSLIRRDENGSPVLDDEGEPVPRFKTRPLPKPKKGGLLS